MAIVADLEQACGDLDVDGVTLTHEGKRLTLPSFERLMLMGSEDIEKLLSLHYDRVTVLQENVGEIGTPAGVYILQNGATVHVEVRHGPSVKFRQVIVYMTINAPTLTAFMDAYAMTLNNKLRGLELRPEDTESFRRVALARSPSQQ
jgi:hypothetical protein